MLLKAHRTMPVGEVRTTGLPTTGARRTPATVAPAPTAEDLAFRYHGTPPQPKSFYAWKHVLEAMPSDAEALDAIGKLLARQGKVPQLLEVLKRQLAVAEEPPAEMLIMPDLSEPEEDKVSELTDEEMTAPAVQVPMLQDVPLSIPVDSSFTQLIDPTVPTKLEGAASSVMAIPLNIQRGRPDTSGIKNLFNIADLDRKPEPIVQTPPVFPYELKQSVSEARVRVGFIVTSRGDVILPYIISSSDRGFERATLDAVSKWKFKPGMRGGKKVNTRVEQPIDFKVVAE
ncbi:MAG: TonB family protein [Opitutae bacterium]|nr:TonB family protein [Opitutae bacterium]